MNPSQQESSRNGCDSRIKAIILREDEIEHKTMNMQSTNQKENQKKMCSRPVIERLVEQRLRSAWGRPIEQSVIGCDIQLHNLIIAIADEKQENSYSKEYGVHSIGSAGSSSRSGAIHQFDETGGLLIGLNRLTLLDANRNRNETTPTTTNLPPRAASTGKTYEQWKIVEERCRTHRQEVAMLDRRGRNCLHAACAKKAPLFVVNAMLEACCRHGKIVSDRDKNGRTPLHIAIYYSNSLEVMKKIVRSCNQAVGVCDHSGHLPLHLACAPRKSTLSLQDNEQLVQLLLDALPSAAARENSAGRTPLHTATENDAEFDIIRMLVQACPRSVVQNGMCGLSPLVLTIRRKASVDVVRVMVEANPSVTLQRDRSGGLPLRRALEHQAPHAILELLCTSKEVVLDTINAIGNTALHETLEWSIPKPETVALFLNIAPEVAITENRAGHTPLTLACQRYSRMVGSGPTRRESTQVRYLWQSLSLLLRAAHYGTLNDNDGKFQSCIGAMSTAATVTASAGVTIGSTAPATQIITATLPHQQQNSTSTLRERIQLLHQQQVQQHAQRRQHEANYSNPNVISPSTTVATATATHSSKGGALGGARTTAAAAIPIAIPPSQPLLHAAVAQNIPIEVIRTALRLHPEQLSFIDCNGHYPLDLILAAPSLKNKTPIIQSVIASFPQAASISRGAILPTQRSPQKKRQLSLFQAAESNSIVPDVLGMLLMAYPPALSQLCPKKRLYPFQIAALPKRRTSYSNKQQEIWRLWDSPVDEDVLQTNAIYKLLRAGPSLVNSYIYPHPVV